MKTAEEWVKDSSDYSKLDIPLCEALSPKLVKQIQLDAVKHGMTLASECIIDSYPESIQSPELANAFDEGERLHRQLILTARDNLKELS